MHRFKKIVDKRVDKLFLRKNFFVFPLYTKWKKKVNTRIDSMGFCWYTSKYLYLIIAKA